MSNLFSSLSRSFCSRLLFATAIALTANLGWATSCCDECDCTYSTDSSPQIVGEIYWYGGSPPVEVPEGSSHWFYVYATDTDKYTEDCPETETYTSYPGDGASANWTASGGSPTSESNTTWFYWTAPTLDEGECEREITITAQATDGDDECPGSGGCAGGNCNDGGGNSKMLQVKVVKSGCDEDLEAKVTAGKFDPDPICVGGETTLKPSASVPNDGCKCADGAAEQYSWSFQTKLESDSTWQSITPTITGGDTANPTVKFTFSSCGRWQVKALASISWLNKDCATRCDADGDDIATVDVVALDKIVLGNQDNAPKACNCGPFTLRAEACPAGASYPPNSQPAWTLEAAPAAYTSAHPGAYPRSLGSGATKEFDPGGIGGAYSFKATSCGSQDEIIVTVVGGEAELEIRWGNQVVSGQTTNTIVGLGMNLTVGLKNAIGQFDGVENANWFVSGERIKDYRVTSPFDQIVDLASTDLRGPTNINFYWVGKQESTETVRALAQVNGPGQSYDDVWCEVKATFAVKRPTMAVSATGGAMTLTSANGNPGAQYTNQGTPPGYVATITSITYPQGFLGSATWAQVVKNQDAGFKSANGQCGAARFTTAKIDGGFPYPNIDQSLPLESMKDAPGIFDNPVNISKLWSHIQFKSYAFFRPLTVGTPSTSTIYISLKQVEWGYSVTLKSQGSPPTWAFDGQPSNPAPTVSDADASTPEWDGHAEDENFAPIPCP